MNKRKFTIIISYIGLLILICIGSKFYLDAYQESVDSWADIFAVSFTLLCAWTYLLMCLDDKRHKQ